MDKPITSDIRLLSFDQIYIKSIGPKLEAIDIFLKENVSPFQVYEVAHILEIDTTELLTLMDILEIKKIDRISFFTLVLHASSEICQLIKRQLKYNHPTTYTPEMIAEIYKLNIHKVKSAFADLSKELITDVELMDVFKRIHLCVFSA